MNLEFYSNSNSYVYYLTRRVIASTRAFNLATRTSSICTREFELLTCRSELVTRRFELVTCGFELVTRNSCFKIPYKNFVPNFK